MGADSWCKTFADKPVNGHLIPLCNHCCSRSSIWRHIESTRKKTFFASNKCFLFFGFKPMQALWSTGSTREKGFWEVSQTNFVLVCWEFRHVLKCLLNSMSERTSHKLSKVFLEVCRKVWFWVFESRILSTSQTRETEVLLKRSEIESELRMT